METSVIPMETTTTTAGPAVQPGPPPDMANTAPDSEVTPDTTGELSDGRRNLVLATVMLGAFMALLDTTIVNVALPSMQHALNASDSALSWIVSGYALAFGLVLIPAGRLGDSIGRKPLYVGGLCLFLLASLGAGLSQTEGQLVAARVVQGIGAGTFYTQINATIIDTFPGPGRRHAFGVLSAIIGVSTAIGPLAGGLLIATIGESSGWRWVFLVNLVIGAVAVPAAIRLLRNRPGRTGQRPDGVAVTLLCAGLLLILYPLIDAQTHGWSLPSFLSIAASVPAFAALAAWELRVERVGRTPLIPPRVLRHASFSAGTIFGLLYFAAFTSIFFVLTVVWQDGYGHSALMTGLLTASFALGSIVSASNSSRLTERLGRRILTIGAGLVALAIVALIVIVHQAGPEPNGWYLVAPLLLGGVGSGLTIAPNVGFTLAEVPREDNGAASGVLNTGQRIGSALGIAIVATVLFETLSPTGSSRRAIATAFTHSFQLALLADLVLIVIALIAVHAVPHSQDEASSVVRPA
jgi:EmrB/QacA subfamily drug resistance transporter